MAVSKKNWPEYIKPHLDRYEKKTRSVFNDFEKERKVKNISAVAESNKLWNAKYKSKIDAIDKKSSAEYKTLWIKYHKI